VLTASNVAAWIPLAALPVGGRNILITPDGRQLAVSSREDTLVYTLPDLNPSDTLLGLHVRGSRICCFSPDGRYFIRLGSSNDLIEVASGTAFLLPGDLSGASAIVVRGGDRPLVIGAIGEGYGSADTPFLLLVEPLAGTQPVTLENPNQFGASLALNADGTQLAVTGNELRLFELPMDSVTPVYWKTIGGAGASAVAYRPGPAGEIAMGGVRLIHIADGTVREFPITSGDIAARIAFHPNGDLMAVVTRELEGSFGGEPRFHLYDVESGSLLLESDVYIGGFAFSPDGTRLVVSDGNSQTWLLGIAAP
jgi:WD40 repeat protein